MFEILPFAGVCVFLVYLFTLYSSTDAVTGIPGPSVFQLLLHIFKNGVEYDVVKIINSLQKKYGQTFSIHIKPFSPIVITSDHNYFTQILTSKEYLDKPSAYAVYKHFLGNSLGITLKLDTWRNDRRILNEAFGHESFKVALEHLDQKLHELEELILKKINEPIDIQDMLHTFILHTTVESLKDPSIKWNSDRTTAYNRSSTVYKEYILTQVITKILNLDVFFKWTRKSKIIEKERKAARQYGMDMVDAHLKANESQIDTNNMIYKMHTAGIPYDRIVDNVLLFIEAGHDTTATTLAYLFYEVAKKPDVQDKINAEINAIIGNDPNATISTADLQQMKYVECVVKEGLRIHTTVSYIIRKLYKPAVVKNVSLPQGTNVVFFIDGLHKSEKYYKDPLVFNPDRFSEENKGTLVPNTWTPFSLGTRNCIGKSLAMQKVKLILAKIVRRFEFSPIVPEHILDIKSVFITKSLNGVPVNVKVRNRSWSRIDV